MNTLPHDHGNHSEEDFIHIIQHTNFQLVSDIFKLLGDCSRLQIFWLLCHCEECVINISAMVDMSSPAVSHHLRILKSSGLITSRRHGKEVYYRASDDETSAELHHAIEKMMELHCPVEIEETAESTACESEQTVFIKAVHQKLTGDLTVRYTIEDLAAEFLINTTTLKTSFKNFYGMPIAAYMKKYRMDAAASMLKNSHDSIANIALQTGYESQGKFANAFKSQMGLSPSEYRKQVQSN